MYRFDEEKTYNVDIMYLDVTNEWIKEDPKGESTRDITDYGFYGRYQYEAEIILEQLDVVQDRILELGSGPGTLCQIILDKRPEIVYHLLDGKGAGEVHKIRKNKGKFFVRNLDLQLDTEDLLTEYDMIIMDDFLEHIRNPSGIVEAAYTLLSKHGKLFISVPNWRMKHSFYYPGLFDYDNFLKFLNVHKFKPINTIGSPMKTPLKIEKLQAESMLDDNLLFDWNWYLISKKL